MTRRPKESMCVVNEEGRGPPPIGRTVNDGDHDFYGSTSDVTVGVTAGVTASNGAEDMVRVRRERWQRSMVRQSSAAQWLRDRGHDVFETKMGAPYDLMVNGWLRVDVKAADYTDYAQRRGRVRGYVFTDLKAGRDCDAFMLACYLANELVAVFAVPACMVPKYTVTITPYALRGGGRYGKCLAWSADVTTPPLAVPKRWQVLAGVDSRDPIEVPPTLHRTASDVGEVS